MYVDVRWEGLEASEAVRLHLERRLAFALGRFGHRLGRVTMYLTSTNGAREGIDQCGRLVVGLQRGGQLVLRDRDADLYVLIDRIMNRARGALLRELGRRRRSRRNSAR